jgi:hypothetical protein
MRLVAFAAGLLAIIANATAASAVSQVDADFFHRRIQPLLAENCFKCHSHSADKIKGGLVLDSRAGLLQGGENGAAIVPGDPEKSLLIQAVRYTDADLQMPPKGKRLDAAQIAELEKWVKLGAPWPGANAAKTAGRPAKFTDEDRQWWAFQPVREPKVPEVRDSGWSRTPIDRFVFRKLTAEGLKPSPEAQRRALARRVFFDLWGLPPSADDLDAFLSDAAPEAYEKLIDRLLASPRYGERWARHWLDLVRYAESDGYRIDDYRPHSWRYRDYVIKSFNDDKPYDRFVREQLAGDEIDPDDPEMLVANSFLRHGIYEYNNRDVRGQWTTILNDVTDVTSDIFLGLGMQCARCHDHKFDPILQKDYYRLQAFFAPMMPRQDLVLATTKQRADYEAKLAKWNELTAVVRQQIEEIEATYRDKARAEAISKFPEDVQELIRKPVPERTPYEHQIAELAWRQVTHEYVRLDTRIKGADKDKLTELRKELARYDGDKPEPLPPAFTVTDVGPVAPAVFIPKGRNPAPVQPGYLSLLDDQPAVVRPAAKAPNSTGRRAELARWLTRPDNPLTTRVIVNRIWQFHFGRGLVGTSSDFGRLGEKPTHPELLEWLASRFVGEGWSIKKLHRIILNSAVYRQSATAPASEEARMKDPENRWLWRMNTRRLDCEQIRDAILAASGELDFSMGGPSVDVSKPRRTIYTKVMRNTRDPLLDVFDAPEGFASTAQRDVTTTPTQALLMFNSQQMLERAKAMAARLQAEGNSSDQRIALAYRLAFGREPASAERVAALRFLDSQSRRIPPPQPATPAYVADKMPYREGKAAVLSPGGAMERFEVARSPMLLGGDFTVEGFVLLKSVYEDSSVRTIAAQWTGKPSQPGWALGVTGRKSMSKPNTLVLQLSSGPDEEGGYEPVFSGLHIELNKPYFVAASLRLAETGEGGVTFYAKDLSNDDEPMQVARATHKVTAMTRSGTAFTMGGRHGDPNHLWDGLIDDVRLSNTVLEQEQLLLTSEAPGERTVGYWQFESSATYFKDASGRGHDIQVKNAPPAAHHDPRAAALVDFCHVLLNANEFLYVD